MSWHYDLDLLSNPREVSYNPLLIDDTFQNKVGGTTSDQKTSLARARSSFVNNEKSADRSLRSVSSDDTYEDQLYKEYPFVTPGPVADSMLLAQSRTEVAVRPEVSQKSGKVFDTESDQLRSQLDEEDQLLLRLKEENLPWKEISARFISELGKPYQYPVLQRRLRRLRERLSPWTDVEIDALRMAHDYWEKNKFEIISQKVKSLPSIISAYINH